MLCRRRFNDTVLSYGNRQQSFLFSVLDKCCPEKQSLRTLHTRAFVRRSMRGSENVLLGGIDHH